MYEIPAYFLYPQQHLRRGSPVKALFGLVVRVHKMLKKRKYFLPNFQLFKKKLYRGKLTPPPPSPEKRIGSHSILICVVVYLYGVAGGQHGELPLPGHVVKVVHQHTGEQGWSM